VSALLTSLAPLLRVLLPVLFKAAKKTSEDGSTARVLRDTLRKRIRETWGRGAVTLLFLVCFVGCANRTIYVPSGTPVRLRETVESVKVWVLDAAGVPTASEMDLPEGWYVLPMPEGDDTGPK